MKRKGSKTNQAKRREERHKQRRVEKSTTGMKAADKGRAEAMRRRKLDTARVMAMNDGLAASHTILDLISAEFASIQSRMDMKDQADMGCIQAALLIAFAQEYTKAVLSTAPVQIRGLGKDWIFSRAQKMRETIFNNHPIETAMEPMPGVEPSDTEKKTDSGLILLS